jgi:hypothetical protein
VTRAVIRYGEHGKTVDGIAEERMVECAGSFGLASRVSFWVFYVDVGRRLGVSARV